MLKYGHWDVLREVDLNDVLAFVYVITFEDGKKYVGAKKIWRKIKQPPSHFKRKSKVFEQSDWKYYTSSSNEVNAMIESGNMPKNYLIIGFYDSWGKALYTEAEMQFSNNVLGSDIWLNSQIEGHFTYSCIDDEIYNDVSRYMRFNVGDGTNHHLIFKIGCRPFYVHSSELSKYLDIGWKEIHDDFESELATRYDISYQLYDNDNKELVNIDSHFEFCNTSGFKSEELIKLVSGDIDILGKYSLHPDIKRGIRIYQSPEKMIFTSTQEAEEYYNLEKGSVAKLCRDKTSEWEASGKDEKKKDYKARLESLNIYKSNVKKYLN